MPRLRELIDQLKKKPPIPQVEPPGEATGLLIAVQDYSIYDASAGNAPGTTSLKAPHNDLRDMLATLDRFGFDRSKLRILSTDPELSDMEPTRANIEDSIVWLFERMAMPGLDQGIIWFAGHGMEDNDLRYLCPSDMVLEDGVIKNRISMGEATAKALELIPRKGLHIFLDSCFAGIEIPREAESETVGLTSSYRTGDAVVSAGGDDQVSVEVMLDHKWRGAFTWSLCRCIERMARVQHMGLLFPDLSYTDLMWRMRAFMDAMDFPHRPQFQGDAMKKAYAVFQPMEIVPFPVGNRVRPEDDRQIWPGSSGIVYKLAQNANGSGQLYGYIEATTGSNAVDNWYKTNGQSQDIHTVGQFYLVETDMSSVPQDAVFQASFSSAAFSENTQSTPLATSGTPTLFKVEGQDGSNFTEIGCFKWGNSNSASRWWVKSNTPNAWKSDNPNGAGFYLRAPNSGTIRMVKWNQNEDLGNCHYLELSTA